MGKRKRISVDMESNLYDKVSLYARITYRSKTRTAQMLIELGLAVIGQQVGMDTLLAWQQNREQIIQADQIIGSWIAKAKEDGWEQFERVMPNVV